MIDLRRLAAYLDDAGDDPAAGCALLRSHQINRVCLRRAWTGPICSLSDTALQRLRELLQQHQLYPLLLHTEVGMEPAPELMRQPLPQRQRPFLLASYFDCSMVRLGAGIVSPHRDQQAVHDWLGWAGEEALSHQLTPVLELTPDSLLVEPAEIITLLQQYPTWRLLYDPALLLAHRNIDPFIRYWALLRDWVVGIDLHDWRVGHGPMPLGQGDCQIARTLSDAHQFGYTGWYLLEPGLGRRYGSAVTRQATFDLAMEALGQLIHSEQ